MKQFLKLIWDNDTIDRAEKQEKALKKIWIFSILFFSIVTFLILPRFTIKEFGIMVLSASLLVSTAYTYFFKIVNYRIKEELSENEKSQLRLLFFALAMFFFYGVWIGILSNYYPFLDKLICCDLIGNVKIEV